MEKDTAILMLDLSGYTAMTDVHGGASAARLVTKYMELVEKARSGNCELVQRVGDQVVMLAETGDDLLATIVQLMGFIVEENHFLSIHGGLHFGSVHYQGGHLFGSTINVASRIMNLAKTGQILCSAAFLNSINRELYRFSPIGKIRFKNVLKEVEVFEFENSNVNPVPIDPVCHMRINEPTRFIYHGAGTTFYFCSQHCLDIFESDTETFIRHLGL